MRWLTCSLRPIALAALMVLAGCAMAAAPQGWRSWELGSFRLQTPAGMQQSAGGSDSLAGAFAADGLRIDYDFGPYASRLEPREDFTNYRASDGKVDGLPARFVQFQVREAPGPARACSGVHVPRVRQSGPGPLALTVLACASDDARLKDVPAILASIRFAAPASR